MFNRKSITRKIRERKAGSLKGNVLPRCGFEDGVSRSADCVYTAAQEVTETAILSSAVTRRGCNFYPK